MSLTPLLSAPAAVQLHVATVMPAFFLGTWLIFFSTKGARLHRAIGYVYLTLMTVTALSTFFIRGLIPAVDRFHGFGPIHLLSLLTLAGVFGALYGARTHNVPMHKRSMLMVYIGGIWIAGAFTLVPGRIMHAVFFGH